MDFTKTLKSIAWTEAEVGTMVAGAVLTSQFLDDTKIFKDQYAKNPQWFNGARDDAPFYIKWSGALKAGGALYATTFVKNPWVKLLLMGVAFAGTTQQVRVLTYNKTKSDYRLNAIGQGNTSQLDEELRQLADQYRDTRGQNYVNGPKYINGSVPLSERYNSSVAAKEDDLGDRYRSSVAKARIRVYDEDDDFSMGWGFTSSDDVMAA